MFTIFKREFLSYFHNPIAYVYLVIYLVLSSIFTFSFGRFMENNQASLGAFFYWQPWLMLFLVPALGMRAWSEEKRTGTAELLLTLPLAPVRMVLGKFFSGWGFLALSLVLTFPMAIMVFQLGEPDLGILLTGYLGCWLLGGCLLAVSVAVSAMSRDQIVCYSIAFFVSLLLMLAGVRIMLLMMIKMGIPDVVMAGVSRLSLLSAFNVFSSGIIRIGDLCLFFSVILWALAVNSVVLPSCSSTWHGKIKVLALTAVLAIVNIFAAVFPVRLDCSCGQIYTVSSSSRQLVKKIEKPVEITFYYSKNYPELSDAMMAFADRTRELLEQYSGNPSGMVSLRIENPLTEEEEKQAEERGVLPNIGSMGDSWYCSVVIASGEKKVCLNGLDPKDAASLEYDISRGIVNVVTESNSRIGILSSLPILGGMDVKTHQELPVWKCMKELGKQFDIEKIGAGFEKISNDFKAVIIVHPQNFTTKNEYALAQYVAHGGSLIVFCDPLCKAAVASSRRINPVVSSQLKQLFKLWKINFTSSEVVADEELATPMVSSQSGLQVQPTLINVSGEYLNKELPFSSSISSLKLFCSGSFSWEESGVDVIPIAWGSKQSEFLKQYEAQRLAADIMQNFSPDGTEKVFALLLQGLFLADFGTDFHNEDHLDSGKGRVLLIGDADMLHDSLCSEDGAEEDEDEQRIVSDNIAFLLNCAEYMTGQEDLAEIRAKSDLTRPLVKIQQMADEAQKNVQKVLTDVRAEELEVMAKLKSLEMASSANSLAAEAEKQMLTEKLEKSKAELYRRQRSELKQLRAAIDSLERRMLAMNLIIPCLIILIGAFVLWHRR